MTDTRASQAPAVHHSSHGNSVAGWTLVGLIMLGGLISCIGIGTDHLPVTIAGAVVIVLGIIVGKVMSVMGYGVAGRSARH